MSNKRKEFTFDLILGELKKTFGNNNYAKGYEELNQFFCIARQFEHRQGSVYCSSDVMSQIEVINMTDELRKQCPWLKTCLRRMDVADIGNLHELTVLIVKDTI